MNGDVPICESHAKPFKAVIKFEPLHAEQIMPKFPSLVEYQSLLASGYYAPLATSTNADTFTDIHLADVVQIVSGEYSMIAVTKSGQVYGRGKNLYGELGLGDNTERTEWTSIPFFADKPVKKVALKKHHALFLTMDSKVFSCGSSDVGALVPNDSSDLTVRRDMKNMVHKAYHSKSLATSSALILQLDIRRFQLLYAMAMNCTVVAEMTILNWYLCIVVNLQLGVGTRKCRI